jgi:5-dehydro-2-deoxygluconokinase
LSEAVLRGSAAAAIVVGRVGCAPAMPTTAELDAFLANPSRPDDPLRRTHAHRARTTT